MHTRTCIVARKPHFTLILKSVSHVCPISLVLHKSKPNGTGP